MPFDHPLWVLYSSGTTGLPKPIVHGQGGILVEQVKKMNLHLDAQAADRVFWFSTTGWMMWNFLVGVLLTDASIVLFDGNPGYPSLDVLWDLAESAQITTFGTSAAYIASCMKEDVRPTQGRDLSALQAVGSTGSPLSPEGFRWVYDQLGDGTWLFSTSGGTDMCTAFVGGVPVRPVYLGELQCRCLGCAVEAWDPDGRALVGEVGELVITRPMPSMPVFFWGDEDGSRLEDSYFSMYPGIWRHGDWIELTTRGTAIIYGRSDSTINRGGRADGDERDLPRGARGPRGNGCAGGGFTRDGTDGWMPLFVVLRDGASLDDALVLRDPPAGARGLLAPPCPQRGPGHSRGAAHAVGQSARGAGQADSYRHTSRSGRLPRVAGQSTVTGLLRRASFRRGVTKAARAAALLLISSLTLKAFSSKGALLLSVGVDMTIQERSQT